MYIKKTSWWFGLYSYLSKTAGGPEGELGAGTGAGTRGGAGFRAGL